MTVYESTVTVRQDRDGNIISFEQGEWKQAADPNAKPGPPVVEVNGVSHQMQDGDHFPDVVKALSRMRTGTLVFPQETP